MTAIQRCIGTSLLTRLCGPVLRSAAGLVALSIAAAWSPAQAQSVSIELHAKTQGDDVLLAVEMTPDFDCYFYDEEPGEYAMPTVITPGGLEGADWSDVWFPEPYVKVDPSLGVTQQVFKKATTFYAVARGGAAEGDEVLADVKVEVTGQVCDSNGCLPFTRTLTAPKSGDEDIWNGFPASLLEGPPDVPAPAAEQVPESEDAATSNSEYRSWTPDFDGEVAKARYFVRVNDDEEVELALQIAVPEGFHMYGGPTEADKGPGTALPTTIAIEGGGVEWNEVRFPEPEKHLPAGEKPDMWVWAYDGSFVFGVTGEELEGLEAEEVEVLVNGQACDENGCTPIEGMAAEYAGEGDDGLYALAFASWSNSEEIDSGQVDIQDPSGERQPAGTEAKANEQPDERGLRTESDSLLGFILLAISAGLITLLMPCTYPMIPITISFFTKQADAKNSNPLILALLYGLGIVAMFVLIGALVGPVIVTFATHPVTNLVIAIVFVLFAFALFGMIDLSPPQSLMRVASSAGSVGGYLGVFLMGLTLVVTSFTCTGPFVGTLLAAGADASGNTSMMKIVLGMAAFGATMATPFVVLALVPGKLSTLPSAGAWMNTLKVFMGFVELAAALKFLSNADIVWGWMLLPREVFLGLWAMIALVAGYYLLGRINLKGESPDGNIGPGRLVGAIATMCFAAYCAIGVVGYQLDGTLMSALAPPPAYTRGLVPSHRPVGGGTSDPLPAGVELEDGGNWMVIDDYDRAREVARANGKLLFLNFTGHT